MAGLQDLGIPTQSYHSCILRIRILSDAIRVKIAHPLNISNRNLDFVNIWSKRFTNLDFAKTDDWNPQMEPWKMIGFGRDTHVNHDYLVTSSSRAVHFIGQPQIQNIFDSEMKSTDSKVALWGRNKTRNYSIIYVLSPRVSSVLMRVNVVSTEKDWKQVQNVIQIYQ